MTKSTAKKLVGNEHLRSYHTDTFFVKVVKGHFGRFVLNILIVYIRSPLAVFVKVTKSRYNYSK